jgi:hypothetical protein
MTKFQNFPRICYSRFLHAYSYLFITTSKISIFPQTRFAVPYTPRPVPSKALANIIHFTECTFASHLVAFFVQTTGFCRRFHGILQNLHWKFHKLAAASDRRLKAKTDFIQKTASDLASETRAIASKWPAICVGCPSFCGFLCNKNLKEKRPGYRLDMIALFKLFVGRKIRAL